MTGLATLPDADNDIRIEALEGELAGNAISEAFDLLVNPSDVRSVLLESGHGTLPRRVAEAKQTSEAMAIALERMLDPWLKGRVPLNVEAVGGLSPWFWDVFERLG